MEVVPEQHRLGRAELAETKHHDHTERLAASPLL
jgi:hypothetical protein